MIAVSQGGTRSRERVATGTGWCRWRVTISCESFPSNGGAPVSIWNSTTPIPYTSARASTSSRPSACSGLMYNGVPTMKPVCV